MYKDEQRLSYKRLPYLYIHINKLIGAVYCKDFHLACSPGVTNCLIVSDNTQFFPLLKISPAIFYHPL